MSGDLRIGGGARLRAAREARGVSVETVAAELRIRVPIIRGLEAEDPTYLPERIYTLGMLRNYATYLALDPEAIVGSWAGFPAVTNAVDAGRSSTGDRPSRLSARLSGGALRTFAAYGGVGVLGIAVALFVGAQVLRYATPPALTVEAPAEAVSTLGADALSFEVRGTTNPKAQVRIQRPGGETITAVADDSGLWSVEVPLDRGRNELNIAAVDVGTGTTSAGSVTRVLIVPLPISEGPRLELLGPANGTRVENAPVHLQLSTEPGQGVTVTATPASGNPVITELKADASGGLATDLLLQAGEWKISVAAAGLGGAVSSAERLVSVDYRGVLVSVEAIGSGTWVRAWADGVVDPSTGTSGLTLVRGGRATFKAAQLVELRFGSPASLTVSINGRILDRLGEVGVAATWAFAADGSVTPSNRK